MVVCGNDESTWCGTSITKMICGFSRLLCCGSYIHMLVCGFVESTCLSLIKHVTITGNDARKKIRKIVESHVSIDEDKVSIIIP